MAIQEQINGALRVTETILNRNSASQQKEHKLTELTILKDMSYKFFTDEKARIENHSVVYAYQEDSNPETPEENKKAEMQSLKERIVHDYDELSSSYNGFAENVFFEMYLLTF